MKKVKENRKNWKVFFDDNKNEYLSYYSSGLNPTAKQIENFIFEGRLKLDSYYRGRSKAGYNFIDSDSGTKFSMGIKHTENLLNGLLDGSVKVVDNAFCSLWTFSKQGENYSLCLYNGNEK